MKHTSKHFYTSGDMSPTCKKASEESNKGLLNTTNDGISSPPV